MEIGKLERERRRWEKGRYMRLKKKRGSQTHKRALLYP